MLGSGVRANIMLTNKIKSHVPYDDWSAMLEVACKQYIDCSVDIEDPNIAHARWAMWTIVQDRTLIRNHKFRGGRSFLW